MPPIKKRKPTNTVRREEAEALKKQIATLQSQVRELQAQAEQAAMTPSDHLLLLGHSLQTKNMLQELLEGQQLVFAGAQSELMNFQEKQTMNPLYSYIHLPKCWEKRKQILVNLKDEKLDGALQYVLARAQNMNLETRNSSEHRYEDAEGNFCCNRFEVNQLVGMRSMKEVYEAAKFFLTNVEISTTEALGHVTVREDYDTIGDDESIGSFRLISARPSGIVTESNKVLYDKYDDSQSLVGGGPCAVMVTDSVDKDDLHPYHPETRVRIDVSAALVMSEVRRTKRRDGGQSMQQHYQWTGKAEYAEEGESGATFEAAEECDQELMVVIRCASFLKVISSGINIPAHALNALGDGSASWIKVMLQTIREFVDAL